MKKLSYIFLGILIGIVLTASAGAYASTKGLVGKKIASEVPIIFNGEVVTTKGSVADGTTLLPVRAIADLFDAKTEYKGGKVFLTTEQSTSSTVEHPATTPTTPDSTGPKLSESQIREKLEELDGRITMAKDSLKEAQEVIDRMSSDPKAAPTVEITKRNNKIVQDAIDQLEKEKADLETQLKALQTP